MLYDIRGKIVNIIVKDEPMELPKELRKKISENFESMKTLGRNIWNGALLCVSNVDIGKTQVNLTCKKSDYAHYLYGEKIGCPLEYECRNLNAGCFIETIDGYYVIGELDDTTSYPNMLQTTGGGIDKKDIVDTKIDVEQTIIRETLEELNINLNDKETVLYKGLSYLFVSGENEQPGVQVFSKAQVKMTASEMEEYFERYNKYLKENKLEVEFKKLHFLKRKNAILELEKLDNPQRAYIRPLILAASKEKAKEDVESR